jgi:hypothetical protein
VKLQNLSEKYAEAATHFIETSEATGDPWVLYMPFNHVHDPQYCSSTWCNSSSVTGKGDAIASGHGGTGSASHRVLPTSAFFHLERHGAWSMRTASAALNHTSNHTSRVANPQLCHCTDDVTALNHTSNHTSRVATPNSVTALMTSQHSTTPPTTPLG